MKPESERRVDPRKPVVWRGHLRLGTEEHKCRVLDINLGGAKVEMDQQVFCDGDATLHISHIGVLKCSIAWIKGTHVGLQFRDGKPEVEFWLGRWAKTLGLS